MSDLVAPAYPTTRPVQRTVVPETLTGFKTMAGLNDCGFRQPNTTSTTFTSEFGTGKVMALFPQNYARSSIGDGHLVWIKSVRLGSVSPRMLAIARTSTGIGRFYCSGTVASRSTYLDQCQPRHANLMKLFDFIYVDETRVLHIISEFYPKGSVYDHLMDASKPALDERLVAKWTKSLFDAVGFLQGRGISHRSITVDHVLITESNDVVISGWLTAVQCWDPTGTTLLMVKRMRRCQRYRHLPPECFFYEAHDPTTIDPWSVSVFSVVALTKRFPFSPAAGVKYREQYRAFGQVALKSKPAFRRFLDGIFRVDPLKRYTLEKLIEDPWIKGDSGATDRAGGQSKKGSASSSSSDTSRKSINKSVKSNRDKRHVKAVPDPGSKTSTGLEGGALDDVLVGERAEYENASSLVVAPEEIELMSECVPVQVGSNGIVN